VTASRFDPEPGLGGVEGRSRGGPHGDAGDDPGRSVDATRHVCGEHGRRGRLDGRDRGRDLSARLAGGARAEQRIDDQRRIAADAL
jgi:hypothetical protein